MLDKIKNVVSNLSKIAVEKQISEKELDIVIENLKIDLLEILIDVPLYCTTSEFLPVNSVFNYKISSVYASQYLFKITYYLF